MIKFKVTKTQNLDDSTRLNMYLDNDLVGYVIITEYYDKSDLLDFMDEDDFDDMASNSGSYLCLEKIYVYDKFRRTGYGHKLLQYLFETFLPKHFKTHTLICLLASPEAGVLTIQQVMDFYEQYGFYVPEGQLSNDTYWMIKSL